MDVLEPLESSFEHAVRPAVTAASAITDAIERCTRFIIRSFVRGGPTAARREDNSEFDPPG
ncbi:hypothetical protein [Nocardia spumae]|uniref:hypothetical protein n=1 Tax=Nocardia spumae TaxID=2887190 RepID=UPI001D15A421|nr:hypothetical protein [Nocardia spumae]